MTPLDLLYSWQSLFLAVVITTVTQSFKGLIEVVLERGGGNGRVRRKSLSLNAALPLFPLFLGGVLGRFFPLRPEYIVRYVNENHAGMIVYVMWGVSVGVLSDYLYQRSKVFLPLPIKWDQPPKHPTKSKKPRVKPPRKPPTQTPPA